MAQNTTPEITSAADRAVATLLADPEHLQTLLSNLVHRAAYLAAKAEWTMEDNFSTTEWLAEDIGRELPEFTWEQTNKADALRAAAGLEAAPV